MSYPSYTTGRSFAGGAYPTYMTSTLASTYTSGQTFTVSAASTWVELGSDGQNTANPLGTSGLFVVVVDAGATTEEKILCSSVNTTSGLITVWTDGTRNGRGWDGSPLSAHAVGSSGTTVYPIAPAVDQLQIFLALSSINSGKVGSLTAADSTITVAGTATAPTVKVTANTFDAYGSAASKVASVTAADGTITVAGTSTSPTVKVGTLPYSQLSGTPSSLPPNGSAGGDLTGTYPNPTLSALSPSPAGTYGSGTAIPVVTVDAKGRITTVTTATPTTDAPSGPAGGDLSGTYPNPTLAAAGTAGTYGSASLVPVITTDSKGRVTGVTTSAPLDATKLPLAGGTMSGAIAMGASKITGLANGTVSSDAAAFGQIPTLTDSVSSTSTTTAATPNSVKTAYDLANSAHALLNPISGLYYKTPTPSLSTAATATVNTTHYTPIEFSQSVTLDRIAISTGSSFSGTASVRLGIFANSSGKPGNLILDAGTVAPTAASTSYAITINQALSAGIYWVAMNTITAATTNTYYGTALGTTTFNPLVGGAVSSIPGSAGIAGFTQTYTATSSFTNAGSVTAAGAVMFTYARVA